MKKYKITYLKNGNLLVTTIEAESKAQAQYLFFMTVPCDDIKKIEEVTDNV